MDPKAISKAHSRLRNAERALAQMEGGDQFADLCDYWLSFLTAWKGVYTVLEQGAKVSPQSRQWFAKKRDERKADQLLQYLFAARNDEEHGLGDTLLDANTHYLYEIPDSGKPDRKVVMRTDPITGRITLLRPDGGPISLIRETRAMGGLMPVTARGGITYGPPHLHLGKELEATAPIEAATLGLAYVRDLVAEAEKMQAPSP